jgi:hypothetical protein
VAVSRPRTPAHSRPAARFAPALAEPRAERLLAHAAGVEGNDRLTSATGLVLLALLAVECATLVSLRSLLGLHISLGLALLVPVAVKLASTGWRFVRYYKHAPAYVAKGPPQIGLRLLGPPLVATTVILFGTGVALLIAGPPRKGTLFTLHKLSFILWAALIAIHVLAHLEHALRMAATDWQGRRRLGGTSIRRGALALTLVATLVVGVATIPANAAWAGWSKTHHRHEHG